MKQGLLATKGVLGFLMMGSSASRRATMCAITASLSILAPRKFTTITEGVDGILILSSLSGPRQICPQLQNNSNRVKTVGGGTSIPTRSSSTTTATTLLQIKMPGSVLLCFSGVLVTPLLITTGSPIQALGRTARRCTSTSHLLLLASPLALSAPLFVSRTDAHT